MNRKLSLEEIHKESLSVLKEFNSICEKNGFEYVLAYGTLIGAIRHQGFIPWDDDVDVWMPRMDYERFIRFCEKNKEKLKPYKLCTRSNTENYGLYIPRFSDLRYRYVNKNTTQRDFNIGTFIDIYPIDNYGNNDIKAKIAYNKIKIWNYLYCIYTNDVSNDAIKRFAKKLIKTFMDFLWKKKVLFNVNKKINTIIEKYTSAEDEYVGCVCTDSKLIAWKRNTFYNKKGLLKKIKTTFEGEDFYIPEEFDTILKTYYGDYMKLPPENKRVPSHEYEIYRR